MRDKTVVPLAKRYINLSLMSRLISLSCQFLRLLGLFGESLLRVVPAVFLEGGKLRPGGSPRMWLIDI
jgi:hypothetical protein